MRGEVCEGVKCSREKIVDLTVGIHRRTRKDKEEKMKKRKENNYEIKAN